MTQHSKSAFVDTNVLVNLYSLWAICSAARISVDSVQDWNQLKAKLSRRTSFAKSLSSEDMDRANITIKCFNNLRSVSGSYTYYSSAICRSEMQHVLLESIGLERLIRQKIPHRLRIKRPQVLFRRAVQPKDYLSLRRRIDGFFEAMHLDYGLQIYDAEQSLASSGSMFGEILKTAEHVWSRVLIEVVDAYIYAAAIEIGADTFITSDGALFEAIHCLSTGKGEYGPINRSLRQVLRKRGVSLSRPQKPQDPLPI